MPSALHLTIPDDAPCVRVCDDSDRASWLAARQSGIGGSDCPAILGLSPWASPLSVQLSKIEAAPPDDDETELQRWGHYVEAPMIQAFIDEQGPSGTGAFEAAQLSGGMYRSEPRPWTLATLDALVRDADGVLGIGECKLKVYGARDWNTGVPDHVVAQAQHALAVTGLPYAIVIALLDGYRLRWKRIERDDVLIADVILPAEERFWEAVQTQELVDAGIGPSGPNRAALRHLFPRDDGSSVDLIGPEWLDAYRTWERAKADEKAAKLRKENARDRLAQQIGKATHGVLDDGTELTLRTDRRGTRTLRAKPARWRPRDGYTGGGPPRERHWP